MGRGGRGEKEGEREREKRQGDGEGEGRVQRQVERNLDWSNMAAGYNITNNCTL